MRVGMPLFSPVRDFRQERLSCGKNPARTPLIYIRNIHEAKPEKKSLGKMVRCGNPLLCAASLVSLDSRLDA